MLRKLILFSSLLLIAFKTSAADFQVKSISYYISSIYPSTVSVGSGTAKYSGSVIIPETVIYNSKTYNVTGIDGSAFANCTDLISVVIPNSVTNIGQWAFGNCTSLTTVTLPSSLNKISNYLFSGCSSLNSINIPNTITSIGDSGFKGCSSLTSFIIPNSVTFLDDSAFEGCHGLTTISIPNSVTTLDWHVFYNCKNLATVNISSSVSSIGWYTFSLCPSLTSINVEPNNMNFSSKDGVLFNKNMTVLINCPGGISNTYTIPNSVTEINSYAFADCKNLTSVVFSNNLIRIDDNAFQRCTSLTSINLPESIRLTGYSAFGECTSLTSITIPANIETIGNYSFSGCTNLNSIHVRASNPLVLNTNYPDSFNGLNTNTCVLYVPSGTKIAYENAPQWWYFNNIVEEQISNIKAINSTQYNFKTNGSFLIISNLHAGDCIEVYSISGEKIFNQKALNEQIEIKLTSKNIYIVKVNTFVEKILLN